jgi:UDP-glucose 4-epimerase
MEKDSKASDMFLINTSSTLNLLEYGKEVGIKKFALASSGAVYGYSEKPLSEESPINPIDFYGLSKYQSELLVNYYAQHFSTVILRLSYPYGPGQVRGIIPVIAGRIKNKEAIIIYNDGNPKIKPTYITDVVKAIDKSLLLDEQCTLNICGDEEISIRELSLLIGEYLGTKPVFKYARNDEIKDSLMTNTNMKTTLNMIPSTSLKQGIQSYIAWRERDEK